MSVVEAHEKLLAEKAEKKRKLFQFLVTEGKFGEVCDDYMKVLICGKFGFKLSQLNDPELYILAVEAYITTIEAERYLEQRERRRSAK